MVYNNIQLVVLPKQAAVDSELKKVVGEKLKVSPNRIATIRITRKSIDARSKQVKVNLCLDVYTDNSQPEPIQYPFHYQDVSEKPEIIVVGAGPAGLFGALRLIELGLKPVVFERGKSVGERKKDIAQLNRNNGLNPESNYCFGEGGAGTFSDGKLFTRIKKKKDCTRILLNFHQHGAQDEILYESHPHIGTDRLPVVIKNMRETILKYGGEVHFESKVAEILTEDDHVTGVRLADGTERLSKAILLATGHSARDVYEHLQSKGIALEAKGFAMGVRVEHPQDLIDRIQYHQPKGEYLPSAAYSLVTQVEGRGVYSFCMCPGGFIVPASTNEGETVVNGMSPSHRNSKYANSAIVVEIRPEDLTAYQEYGVMAGLKFQETYERLSFQNGGGNAIAPAQRMQDFIRGKKSKDLPATSYIPGILSSEMSSWMPPFIGKRLQAGFLDFEKKMRGFVTNDAILIGVESRTSSPIRIPRDAETLQHISIKGLYPCGEGAGYAGGITSSAMDGEACAEKIAAFVVE
ncbi:MAG: NAD(P)/FAD-dependent oxidoreductase [Paludibacteraceae bacterium]|nr:NAD(P)/FAD-dependent oxidoreductase [Paludibacteraceae bacterium]